MAYIPLFPSTVGTDTTTWGGWQIMNPMCYGCSYGVLRYGKLVCYCASRTIRHGSQGDSCMSYKGRR